MNKTTLTGPGPYPEIPIMQGDIIFFDDLEGGNLETYVSYPDIAIGHEFIPHWRGRDPDGLPVDDADKTIIVSGVNLEDGRVRVTIARDQLEAIRGGEAFYSYNVLTSSSEYAGESNRLLCFIDRPPMVELYPPVPQIRESHDLHIDISSLNSQILVCAAPYAAMAIGDVIQLTWQGYRSNGQPVNPPWDQDFEVASLNQVGQPMVWNLPVSALRPSRDAYGMLSYTIVYANPHIDSPSVQQRFTVSQSPPGAVWLDAPEVVGFSGGVLDPSTFPEGVTVRCPLHARLLIGDVVLLHWVGNNSYLVRSLTVDPSILDSQKLEFVILPAALISLGVGESTVRWQFARSETGATSESLGITFGEELVLPFPLVIGVLHEKGEPEDSGYLYPNTIALDREVTIRLPETAQVGGATLYMHWDGNAHNGKFIQPDVSAHQPTPTFKIPALYAASNMGNAESKRFNVFYRAWPDESHFQDSASFKLLIKQPQTEFLPALKCDVASSSNTLSLALAKASGITLYLERWLFMATGQLLWINGTGGTASGDHMFWATQNEEQGQAVTDSEAQTGNVKLHVPSTQFTRLAVGKNILFSVQVSFDNGETRLQFPSLNLELIN